MTPRRISIEVGNHTLTAQLNQSSTADAVWEVLPIRADASVWGDEIYFGIPVDLDAEPHARAEVEIGALAYWPPGNAFCIFWGPTPASRDKTPTAASPVNRFGKVEGDATVLQEISAGASIAVHRLESSE